MQIKFVSFLAMIVGLIILGLSPNGYGPSPVSAQSQAGEAAPQVERIAVTPFFGGRCGSDLGEILNCPITWLSYDRDNVSEGFHRILTSMAQEALKERHDERVIALTRVIETYEKIGKDESVDTLRTVAQELGRALGVNLIFVGTVWRYRDKV